MCQLKHFALIGTKFLSNMFW